MKTKTKTLAVPETPAAILRIGKVNWRVDVCPHKITVCPTPKEGFDFEDAPEEDFILINHSTRSIICCGEYHPAMLGQILVDLITQEGEGGEA